MSYGGEYAIILLIACVIGGGVCGAVLRSWSLDRRLYSLEVAVGELQGLVTREVKIRAAQTRTPSAKIEREAAELLKANAGVQPALPMGAVEWWKK